MVARAIVHRAPQEVELREFTLRAPGPGEVLVRAHYTCISPGTELRCLAGRQPNAVPFPYIPGYAMTGEVVETGEGGSVQVGQRVYLNGTQDGGELGLMWGGHASHAVARAEDCIPVPDGLDLADASFAHLAAIALNGTRVADVKPGETVLVIGLGVLGQLCARLYAASGVRTVGCDVAIPRVARAQTAGIEAHIVNGSLPASLARFLPRGADVVVDVTGSTSVLPEAIKVVREVPWGDPPAQGGRYVIQGSYPGDVAIPYQDAFLKELTFLIPRDCRPSQRRAALDLMASGKLRVRDLISDIFPPDRAPSAYNLLSRPNNGLLTVVFDWTGRSA